MRRPPTTGSADRSERAFLLRVWREAGEAPADAFRGSVVELGTDRRLFFTELADLKDFLSLRLSPADGPDG